MTLADTDAQIAQAIASLKNETWGGESAQASEEGERAPQGEGPSFRYRAMSNGDDAIEIASLSGRDVDVLDADIWVSFSL